MLSNGRWSVYVRDANYQTVAQLDDFASLECVERHLGLGTWILEADFAAAGVDTLVTTDGSGIIVKDVSGRVVFSGPMRPWHRERSADADRLRVSGWDDMVVLHARVVHPQPLTAAPPFSTAAHDTHTGAASTVLRQFIDRNVGPSALAARQWSGLTLAADPAEGPSITVSGRWQNLLAHLAGVASPNLMSILVRQEGSGLVATVRASRDRTNVELSPRAGTLQGWTLESTPPEMTAGWAGGQGDLTAREVVQDETTPPAEWPLRFERFVDYSNAENAAELSRKLSEALTEAAAKTSLELFPVEGSRARYGVDFDLGDKVSVVVGGVASTEVVTSATLRIGPDGGVRSFGVGPEQNHGPAAVFAQLRQLGARVRNLEGS